MDKVQGCIATTVWDLYKREVEAWMVKRTIDSGFIAQFNASVEGQLDLFSLGCREVAHKPTIRASHDRFTLVVREAFYMGVAVDVTIKLRIGNALFAEVTTRSWEIW